jgi:signal transduction histidine kinase/ActR/RegA family two-component response regulator
VIDRFPVGGEVRSNGDSELASDISIVDDVEQDPRWTNVGALARAHDIRASWCFPVRSYGGKVLGELALYFDSVRKPSQRDRESLELLSKTAALIIERHNVSEALAYNAEALREADRRKDEFLATLAHELRNPLAPLRSGLQVMKLARDDAATVEQARAMMERQIIHMVRLIDDLLDVSRISRGRIELRREPVELARVVHHAVETSKPLIDAGAHQLHLDLPENPIIVQADFTRLSQVFANLLNNAAKFTERGGRIEVRAAPGRDSVDIVIRDNGIGIPSEMLPRVFDLFTQVDHSLERAHSGLGIGLSLVKGLVELHGGRVDARSGGEGTGAEFIVHLPVTSNLSSGADPERRLARTPSATGRKILIVDDNHDATTILDLMLRYMGSDTRTAHDGLQALEVAEEFRPDVVLMDIGMPRVSGYDAARRIREQAWGAEMILVALTGWGQEEDRRRSMEAGFNFHLVKPVAHSDIMRLLDSLPAVNGQTSAP